MSPPITLALALLLACASEPDEDASDIWVVYGILDTEAALFNLNFAGQPVGRKDVLADCPLGGTAHIVGVTGNDGTIESVVFTITMEGCANSGLDYDLSFDGVLEWQGTFASTGYKMMTSQSDSLTVVGTCGGAVDGIDRTCPLAVTDRGSAGEESYVTGDWCERPVEF